MKKELIRIIKLCGIDLRELVIDIVLESYIFNTIELLEDDSIILHTFHGELDIETNWIDLSAKQHKEIVKILKPYIYN